MTAARVKICGLTDPGDAVLAADLGAWAVGVILAPESPRQVDTGKAAAVLEAVPEGVERVGVFVNAEPAYIGEAAQACGLTAVQLHGEESRDECIEVRRRTGCAVIKALRVAGPDSLDYVVQFDTDFILLDTYHPKQRGGTGEAFDWSLAAGLPKDTRASRLILSGGIGPDNAVEAINTVNPFAIDVSSGVEVSPGLKDKEKMTDLFSRLSGLDK